MRKRHNPFGLDLNTFVVVGVGLFLFSKLKPSNDPHYPPECFVGLGPFQFNICKFGNEQVDATPVGGTRPDGRPLNYGIDNVAWDSTLGILRAGRLVFHVGLVHQGPADTPTVAILLDRQQVGATQIGVTSDIQNRSYQVDIATDVQAGVYPLGVMVLSGGSQGGVALNQAMLQTITVYP